MVDQTVQRIDHEIDWATIAIVLAVLYALHRAGVFQVAGRVTEAVAGVAEDRAPDSSEDQDGAAHSAPELSGGTA
jgi:hypothetical protein